MTRIHPYRPQQPSGPITLKNLSCFMPVNPLSSRDSLVLFGGLFSNEETLAVGHASEMAFSILSNDPNEARQRLETVIRQGLEKPVLYHLAGHFDPRCRVFALEHMKKLEQKQQKQLLSALALDTDETVVSAVCRLILENWANPPIRALILLTPPGLSLAEDQLEEDLSSMDSESDPIRWLLKWYRREGHYQDIRNVLFPAIGAAKKIGNSIPSQKDLLTKFNLPY